MVGIPLLIAVRRIQEALLVQPHVARPIVIPVVERIIQETVERLPVEVERTILETDEVLVLPGQDPLEVLEHGLQVHLEVQDDLPVHLEVHTILVDRVHLEVVRDLQVGRVLQVDHPDADNKPNFQSINCPRQQVKPLLFWRVIA